MLKTFIARCARWYLYRHPTYRNRFLARDRVRKWSIDRELVVSTKCGFRMAVSPSDYISYSIYFFGDYDPLMTAFMEQYLEPDGVCWDVGTERGWFSLVMARAVGPAGRVDAFEAYPPTYRKLVDNISLNGFRQIRAFNLAVSDQAGTLHFVPPSDEITHYVEFLQNCGGVGYVTQSERQDSIQVEATTLDEHAARHPLKRLDLVKIDIEGEELRALRGAEKTLLRFRPLLAVEYNRETAERAGSSVAELDAYLAWLGYDRYTIDWGSSGTLELTPLDLAAIPDVYNVYCLPGQKDGGDT